jgi:hypothetical protein
MNSLIEVRDQIRLSLKEVVAIVVSGIQHRFLRSTLTMSVILLAVAFFMSMLSESVFIKSTGRAVQAEILERKAPTLMLRRMFSKPSTKILRKHLVQASEAELARMSVFTGTHLEDLQRLSQQCQRMDRYRSFFQKLDVGKRLALIGKRKADAIYIHLQPEKVWKEFLKALDPMHSVKIPGKVEEFRGFLDRFDTFRKEFSAFHLAWNQSIELFSLEAEKLMGTPQEEEWIRGANEEQLKTFVSLATRFHFDVELKFAEKMKKSFRDEHLKKEMLKSLNSVEGRRMWAKAFRTKHDLDEKIERLSDPRATGVLKGFSSDEIVLVKGIFDYDKHLGKLSDALVGKTELEGDALLSKRQIFLLTISFLVCMVGIANAMLMSITERFREIATMKCLGATDGFILTQFLVEAAIQGVVGGVVGMFIGLSLSIFKGWFLFGGFMFENLDVGGLTMTGLISMVSGILLSMLASLYPSWSASRMAPMEAMRIE